MPLIDKTTAFIRRNYSTIMMSIIITIVFVLLGYAIADNRASKDEIAALEENQRTLICAIDKTKRDDCDKKGVDLVRLSEDLIYLSDRGIFYDKCLARMFVEWTNNQTSIELDRLTECEYKINNKQQSQNFNPSGNDERNTNYPGNDVIKDDDNKNNKDRQNTLDNQNEIESDPSNPIEVFGMPVCTPIVKICVER